MKFKKGIILFFVAFITIGAIGIPVFKHTCTTENITEHSILVPSNHCIEKEEKAKKIESCCSHEVSFEKEDCCSDEVSELKFTFDIFQKVHLDYYLVQHIEEFSVSNFICSSFTIEETVLYSDSSPPPLTTLNFLRKNCIWRI